MSRRAGKQKRSESDDDDALSTAGKVALGVAAAAAGAAIGYFGSRLLSAWLSEPEEEKQKKCDASKSDDSKCDEAKLPSKDDMVNTDGAHCTPRVTACHMNTSTHAAVQQPSLHQQLFEYYREYVDIPSDKMQAAQKVADKVTTVVKSHLREPNIFKGLALKIGDLVPFGSMTEGLQVIRPNCFNVMIPMMFGSPCHVEEATEHGRKVTGSFVIVVPDDCISNCDDMQVCDEEQRLVTRKLLDVLQAVIQKAVEVVSSCHCNIQAPERNATAVSVAVYADGHDNITVNFVPFVIIDSHLFLPVADPSWFSAQSDIGGRLWAESFVRQEKWSIDRFESSVCGHLIVLKILKAIRMNHREQFGAISSYHLKILLFHMLEDLPDSCDWDRNAVGERLIDLLSKLTEVLREHQMPHYFLQNLNMLEDVPLEMCNNLAKFLGKKLAHNDITSLLKRDY